MFGFHYICKCTFRCIFVHWIYACFNLAYSIFVCLCANDDIYSEIWVWMNFHLLSTWGHPYVTKFGFEWESAAQGSPGWTYWWFTVWWIFFDNTQVRFSGSPWRRATNARMTSPAEILGAGLQVRCCCGISSFFFNVDYCNISMKNQMISILMFLGLNFYKFAECFTNGTKTDLLWFLLNKKRFGLYLCLALLFFLLFFLQREFNSSSVLMNFFFFFMYIESEHR